MERAGLTLLLEQAGMGKPVEGEWLALESGRLLTVHVGTGAGALALSKQTAVNVQGDALMLRNARGEVALCSLASVLAITLSAEPTQARKAGFNP